MRETGKIQKQILEQKRDNINKNIENLTKKIESLEKQLSREQESLQKITYTLSNFGVKKGKVLDEEIPELEI